MDGAIRRQLSQIEGRPDDEKQVLLALSITPDETCLDDLRIIGLRIEKVIKNKIIGTISAKHLADLRAHEQVTEVELSTQLKPNKSIPR